MTRRDVAQAQPPPPPAPAPAGSNSGAGGAKPSPCSAPIDDDEAADEVIKGFVQAERGFVKKFPNIKAATDYLGGELTEPRRELLAALRTGNVGAIRASIEAGMDWNFVFQLEVKLECGLYNCF